jgi:hypothetical protein
VKGLAGNIAGLGCRFKDERSEAALAAADRRSRARSSASDDDYVDRIMRAA